MHGCACVRAYVHAHGCVCVRICLYKQTPPQTQTQHGFPYILAVTIVSGHSLVARDSNGLSDPYVKMKIGSGYSKAKTTIVHKSLSPIWNESFDLGKSLLWESTSQSVVQCVLNLPC